MTEAAIRRAVRLANKTLGKKKKRRHFEDGGDAGGGDGPSTDRDSGWGGWGGDSPRADSLSQSEQSSADRSYSGQDTSDRGGGGRESPAYSSPTSDQTVAELNRQAMETTGFGNGSSDTSTPSIVDRALNVVNQVIGVTPAEAESLGQGKLPEVERGGVRYANQNELNQAMAFRDASLRAKAEADKAEEEAAYPITGYEKPIGQTTTFGSGIVPVGVWTDQQMSMPNVRSPEQMMASQAPTDDFASRMAQNQAMRDAIRAMEIGSLAQPAGTFTSPYELARAAGTPTSGYTDLAQAAGTPTAGYNPLAQAAGTYTSPYELARAAGTPTAGYDPTASGFDAASAAANLKAPLTDAALKAARDAIKQNLGTDKSVTGDGATVASSGVPSPNARVPMPPIPYRDLGQGNILDNVLKVFGMDTESWINNKAKQYEDQGMSPSDAAIQASYDLRDIQLGMRNREGGGGGGGERQAAILPSALPVATETAAAAPSSGAKLPGVAAPYVPPGRKPYASTAYNYGVPTYVSDLGAADSIRRQAQYNEAIRNALRLIG